MAEDYNQAAAAAAAAAATGMCGGGGNTGGGGGGGGNWWDNTTRTTRFDTAQGGSSTCSSTSGTNYGWLTETVDINARSSMESSSTTSSSAVFHGGHDHVSGQKQLGNSVSSSTSGMLMLDPNLQMMGLGLSSQGMDWTQPAALLRNEKGAVDHGTSFRSLLQDDDQSGLVFGNSPVELIKQGGCGGGGRGFSLDHEQHHDQFSNSNNSMESTVTCQGGGGLAGTPTTTNHHNDHNNQLVHSFPNLDSSIYGTTSPSPSTLLLQGLMGGGATACGAAASPPPQPDHDHHHQHHQQLNYGYHHHHHQQQQQQNYGGLPPISNNNMDLMSSWPSSNNNNKAVHHHQAHVVPQFLRASPTDHLSPKQTLMQNQLHFTNNAPFWNAATSAAAAAGLMTTGHDNSSCRPTSFFPSSLHTQLMPTIPTFEDNKQIKQNTMMEARDTATTTTTSASSMKKNDQTTTTASKRGRNENNSSNMPSIKVRKEKMGDRITALQQLVSPFGKTDTASVLSEAIEYIKFLHEQVNVLSTPYLKSGNSSFQHQQQVQQQQQQNDHHHKSKVDPDGPKQDLKSRGLCLVPVSSTFPVAHEASSVDFGTPSTFGGFFR